MFEERKEKGLRTISKKQKKVEELEAIINEEVTPKLERLREEKRSYLLWQKTCTELERIGHTLRAWWYMEVIQRVIKREKRNYGRDDNEEREGRIRQSDRGGGEADG